MKVNVKNEHPLQGSIKKRIIAVCESEPAVAAAYLFGSFAQGKGTKSSDIDIAVLLDDSKSAGFAALDFITMLEKQTACKVDLLVLNRADEVLKFEVRSRGRLIYERSREYRKRFELMSRKLYQDFLYLHRKYVKSVLYGGADGR